AFAEHILALTEFGFEVDWADLPACQRNIGNFLGDAYPPFHPAFFRHGEMAGDAFDIGIVQSIGGELVVWREPFEDGGASEDKIGLFGSYARFHGDKSEHGSKAGGDGAQETLLLVSRHIGITGSRRKGSRPQPFFFQ